MKKISVTIIVFASFYTACSNNSSLRGLAEDDNSKTADISNQGSSSQSPQYANDTGTASQEITGMELTDIKISNQCTTAQCTTVRYKASVKKTGTTAYTDFNASTLAALGIKSFSWVFDQLPTNVVCASEGDDSLRFSPSCNRLVNVSLANETLHAKLSLVFSDDSTVAGLASKVEPDYSLAMQGDLLKVSDGVWQDLKGNGLLFTEFLSEPGGNLVAWSSADSICKLHKDPTGGTNTWRLPTASEVQGLSSRGLRIKEPNLPQVLWTALTGESSELSTGLAMTGTLSTHYILCVKTGIPGLADGIPGQPQPGD